MADNPTELAGGKTTEPAKARGKSTGDKSGQKPRPQPTSKKKRKGKTKQREASTLSSIIVILLVILLPPLPFALYMAGTEWIFSGAKEVPAEFIGTYILGIVVFVGGVVIHLLKDYFRKDK